MIINPRLWVSDFGLRIFMTELWLRFTDENGSEKRLAVKSEQLIVGRHSTCDLSVADGRLSREHLKIERFGDIFVASDCGSSNGTTLNGAPLARPTTLKNDDELNLGGGLGINIELTAENFSADDSFDNFADDAPDEADSPVEQKSPVVTSAPPNAPKSQGASVRRNDNSLPKSFFYLAPLFGFIVLLAIGGLIFVLSGNRGEEVANSGDDFIYSTEANEDSPTNANRTDPAPDETPKIAPTPIAEPPGNSTAEATITPESPESPTPTPKSSTDTAKIEQNSAAFLRRIAQNDPKAFLTSDQAQIVGSRVKQFGGSAALADNLRSAKANAAQIQALAVSKNLKPQFLAGAALAKLGNNRGNVLQTAQGMIEVLDKLSIQVGSELADDVLLILAAYDQGAAGDFLKLRNMLQQLSNQFPESSRTIRTIWFLRKNGKITEAEFEFAVRFLAIGTIAQNPKDFGVNAEELKLN